MILGISLDENYVYVSVEGTENVLSFPFSIGRNISKKTWFIGDEAKNENVDNVDIVIDKLFYIMENDGNARIGEEEYTAKELVKIFFENLLMKFIDIEYVTIVVRQNNVKILSKIKYAFDQYFKHNNIYKITTYSEAFVAYLKSKDQSYYRGLVSLFDFTEKAITYYELVRYKSQDGREYWQVNTKEYLALPLDLLSGDAGKRVCDNLLLEFSKKCISKSAYSNIILSGLGFVDSSSYREFMTYVCTIANVETDVYFFAKSSVLLSKYLLDANKNDNITVITDARTTASIKILAMENGEEKMIPLIDAGDEWFYINEYTFNVILNGNREIRFEILKVLEGNISDEIIIINDSKARIDKTNMFEINLMFMQQNLVKISVIDKGFGNFFEASVDTTSKTIEI